MGRPKQKALKGRFAPAWESATFSGVNYSRAPDDDPSLTEAVAVGAGGDVQLSV